MLIELIKGQYETISIVGMAKNAGKTVTLNTLLDEAYEEDVVLGLTSIGRDGEKQDLVTFTEKPMIYAYEKTIVATAEMLFEVSEAKMEVLAVTDFRTSMGKIVIARVINPGHVQLAGPCSNAEIMKTSDMMKSHGAKLVVIDGAIDRKSTASPSITDASILSTGAALSRDMQKAIEKTVHQVSLFNIKRLTDNSIRTMAIKAIGMKQTLLINEDGTSEVLAIKTALNAGCKIASVLKDVTRYVVIPGSLVSKTVLDIIKTSKHYKQITVIIQDATRIFIDYRDWIYFKKINMKIHVIDEIKLIAVTVNPYSPEGYFFDSEVFKEKLQHYLSDVPVINVMTEN